jgi:hypothetical protein
VPPPAVTRVLVVANKTAATPSLVEAVRARAEASPAEFVLLFPNPDHLAFDRVSHETRHGEQMLETALPAVEQAAGKKVEGRIAASPNAYDDIVEELNSNRYNEIILETIPAHVSHWLHLDLPQRVGHLGYPLTTVEATH